MAHSSRKQEVNFTAFYNMLTPAIIEIVKQKIISKEHELCLVEESLVMVLAEYEALCLWMDVYPNEFVNFYSFSGSYEDYLELIFQYLEFVRTKLSKLLKFHKNNQKNWSQFLSKMFQSSQSQTDPIQVWSSNMSLHLPLEEFKIKTNLKKYFGKKIAIVQNSLIEEVFDLLVQSFPVLSSLVQLIHGFLKISPYKPASQAGLTSQPHKPASQTGLTS